MLNPSHNLHMNKTNTASETECVPQIHHLHDKTLTQQEAIGLCTTHLYALAANQ